VKEPIENTKMAKFEAFGMGLKSRKFRGFVWEMLLDSKA